jgi:hypothetical protein
MALIPGKTESGGNIRISLEVIASATRRWSSETATSRGMWVRAFAVEGWLCASTPTLEDTSGVGETAGPRLGVRGDGRTRHRACPTDRVLGELADNYPQGKRKTQGKSGLPVTL